MHRLRPILFYALLLVSVAGAIAWMLHVPTRPERAYRAAPAQAVWISRHRNWAGRWPEMSRSPLLRQMNDMFGAEPAAWDALLRDPSLADWIRRLGRFDIVLCAGPEQRGAPWAFTLSAWIGSESQTFRLWIQAGRAPGIVPAGDYGGRRLWSMPSTKSADGRQLFFALEEGLWIASWSAQPGALCRALDAYDGVVERHPAAAALSAETADDAGWWNLGIGPGPDAARLRIREWTDRRLVVAAELEGWQEMTAAPESPGCPPERLASAWGLSPEMIVACDWRWLREWLPWDGPWRTELKAVADRELRGPMAIALFGAPLWGRWQGLRIPGLAAMAELRDPAALETALGEAMDRVNARAPWGLISGADLHAPGMRVFEASGAGAYRERPAGERAAYTLRDDWLWAAVSAETLRGLMDPAAAANGVDERRSLPLEVMPWRDAMAPGAPVRVWLDIERSSRTLRMAIALYELQQVAAGVTTETPGLRFARQLQRRVDQSGAWSSLHIRARPESGRMSLECAIEMARPPSASGSERAEE
ncbi:MAG: hypothetical protein KBA51_08000 [Kiritimatiellae bacterium]|nr:hypothetical protein [Kiritimatiellia bacterium]